MNPSFLEVENLTKRFGGLTAVDHVSFRIHEGEIVGLIGPNGSGKTTVFRLITGLLKPSTGKLRFKGEEITGRRPWDIVERGIAGTFQVVRPFRRLPCITNVMVACLSPRAVKAREGVRAETRARDTLDFVGIADLALERASTLSHGDLRRLEIARAIATESELLLLDEPFAGLNPAEAGVLATAIGRLRKGERFGRLHSKGIAMLIVEHNLMELTRIVDRVIVINFGKIIAEGTPQEIAEDKRVIEAYTGKGGR